MSSRTGSGEAGYVSVYVALVTTMVLVPMVFIVIDLATVAYYRTKLKSTADAVAIAAVAESRSFHIPIPTDWVGWFPVNGWLLNGLHLKNLSVGGEPEPKLHKLAQWNQDELGMKVEKVSLQTASVYPLGNLFSPVMYVRMPVEADVKLQTPYLAQMLGKTGTVKVRAESCAVAWYRPDRWLMRWWDANPESFVNTLDNFINVENEPLKYYRLVNCMDEFSDFASLVEIGLTEHLELSGDAKEFLDKWSSGKSDNKHAKKAREAFKKGPPERCGPGDPCVEGDKDVIDKWGRKEKDRRKAEEEAEAARKEAIRQAQEQQAAQPGQQQSPQ